MHALLLARLWLYLLGVAYPALGLSMLRSFTNTGRPPSRRSGDFLLPGYGRLWRRHGWRPVDAPAHPEHWRQVEQAMIDTPVVAALDMYVEPDCVRQAGRGFIDEVCRRLGVRRCAPAAAELAVQWRQPNLLFAQACGYPLVTQLQGQVAVLAVPSYDLADCAPGEHCSLFVAAEGEARRRLDEFRDTRLALNGHDSNSGMNLLRHALAPLGRDAAFFAEVRISGGHVRSLAMVAAGEAEFRPRWTR